MTRNQKEKECSFILIFVPLAHQYKLTNMLIDKMGDLAYVSERLKQKCSYAELWVCTNWGKMELQDQLKKLSFVSKEVWFME